MIIPTVQRIPNYYAPRSNLGDAASARLGPLTVTYSGRWAALVAFGFVGLALLARRR